MAGAFDDFRRVVTEGTVSGHYLTEGFRTSPDSTDLISLHGLIHNEHDLTLLKVMYGDHLIVWTL
jgi:hypothetical protein